MLRAVSVSQRLRKFRGKGLPLFIPSPDPTFPRPHSRGSLRHWVYTFYYIVSMGG
ncbi:hypothetical protein Zm00014a_044597 [Zea mays]|uniref:Uncharacterized protein n=1 Tax=Zea mays TaxID=4577 RepID=A0A3L6FSB2_MAIZE|nr:hypothetical protein Zm00014a_044597 [Zea mays]